MSILNEPDDVLGLALKNLLAPLLEDEKFAQKIKKLGKKTIIMELVDIYSITLIFNDGNILIEYGERPKYDLKLIVTMEAFVGIADGKLGIIKAALTRKVKVKKMYHIFTILKFRSIFFPAIKQANENPTLEGVINVL